MVRRAVRAVPTQMPERRKRPILLSPEEKGADLHRVIYDENRNYGFLQRAAAREAEYARIRRELWEARWPGCWVAAVRNALQSLWNKIAGWL